MEWFKVASLTHAAKRVVPRVGIVLLAFADEMLSLTNLEDEITCVIQESDKITGKSNLMINKDTF